MFVRKTESISYRIIIDDIIRGLSFEEVISKHGRLNISDLYVHLSQYLSSNIMDKEKVKAITLFLSSTNFSLKPTDILQLMTYINLSDFDKATKDNLLFTLLDRTDNETVLSFVANQYIQAKDAGSFLNYATQRFNERKEKPVFNTIVQIQLNHLVDMNLIHLITEYGSKKLASNIIFVLMHKKKFDTVEIEDSLQFIDVDIIVNQIESIANNSNINEIFTNNILKLIDKQIANEDVLQELQIILYSPQMKNTVKAEILSALVANIDNSAVYSFLKSINLQELKKVSNWSFHSYKATNILNHYTLLLIKKAKDSREVFYDLLIPVMTKWGPDNCLEKAPEYNDFLDLAKKYNLDVLSHLDILITLGKNHSLKSVHKRVAEVLLPYITVENKDIFRYFKSQISYHMRSGDKKLVKAVFESLLFNYKNEQCLNLLNIFLDEMYKRILRSEQPKYDELILSFMIKDHRYDLIEDLFLKKKNLTLQYFFIQNIHSLEVNDITLKTMVAIIKKYDGYSLEQFAPFVDIMFINKKKEFYEVKEILATHKSCSASALIAYMEVLEKENKTTIKTLVDRMDKSDKYTTKYLCQLITKSPFFEVEMNYSEEGQVSLK